MELNKEQRVFLQMIKDTGFIFKMSRTSLQNGPLFLEVKSIDYDVDELRRNGYEWEVAIVDEWVDEVLNKGRYQNDDLCWINSIRFQYIRTKKLLKELESY